MDPRILYSAESALLFFIIASPFMYGLTQKIFGRLFAVTKGQGAVTLAGVFLHAVVFGLLVYVLMITQTKKEFFTSAPPATTTKPTEPTNPNPKNVA